jgi:hypothetical protein
VKLDDVLFAGMRETIAHEVGHALGLRHNFKGSAAVTWDQSQDPAFTKVCVLLCVLLCVCVCVHLFWEGMLG